MTVHLFFDESGNLDFSPNGTGYYYFGVLTTRDPLPLTTALTNLRYDLISEGLELECFHATEDRQPVRDRVFEAIIRVGNFEFDAVIIEKAAIAELFFPNRFEESESGPVPAG